MSSSSAINRPVFTMGKITNIPSLLCVCRDRAEHDRYVEYGSRLGWNVRATTELDEAISLSMRNTFDVLAIAGLVQGVLGIDFLEKIRNEPGANQRAPAILVANHKNVLEMKAIERRDHINIEHIEFGQLLLSSFRIIVIGLMARTMKASVTAERSGP
ncbi:hypothetical protein [Jiella sonneratiae]|uniref:Uncharacterized protein n=1 Tax=Jiella sonneratiae TaxID=2816856 RepID=A0ABS3J9F6_9HYPH|nr:hypothetical protein [Jiella sonneratiae]MBO0906302.1 hypothetical protein [Jiella sonneratiae]